MVQGGEILRRRSGNSLFIYVDLGYSIIIDEEK